MQKTLATLFTVVAAAACGDDHSVQPDAQLPPTPDAEVVETCTPKTLRTDLTWYGNNRTRQGTDTTSSTNARWLS